MSRKIWARWTSKKKDGSIIKLRIEEATDDKLAEILKICEDYLLSSECIFRASGIYKREESRKEVMEYFRSMLSSDSTNCCVCYVDEDSVAKQTILGVSIMKMVSLVEDQASKERKEKAAGMAKTPECKKMMEILKILDGLCDERKLLGVDKTYSGRGIIVKPDYRGLGIANKFVETRRLICLEQGIPATDAKMSAIGTQRAATKDGWHTLFEIPFNELGKLAGVEFDAAPPLCKFMAVKVDKVKN